MKHEVLYLVHKRQALGPVHSNCIQQDVCFIFVRFFCISSHWRAQNVLSLQKKGYIIICTMTVKYDKHLQSKFVNYFKNGFVVCLFQQMALYVELSIYFCFLCKKSIK